MVTIKKIVRYVAAPLLVAGAVHGHGYISKPAARNMGDSCRQCLSAGGPASVNAGGQYRRGMCGNAASDTVQGWNVPGPIQATYSEGQTVDFEVVITAHHLGYFDFQLCPKQDITDECFNANRLLRAGCTDKNDRNCLRAWKTVADYEKGSWVVTSSGYHGDYTNSGTTTYKMRFQLPTGVTCSHCVLRWHYYTTNSCNPTNPTDDINQVSEEFFNCADISIVPASGASPPSTAATTAQINALRSAVPRDLRPLGMGYQCPERGLGYDREYLSPTSMMCWAADFGTCSISTSGTTAPPPTTTTTSTSATFSASSISSTSSPTQGGTCGTCTGCLWIEYNACYTTWSQAVCNLYTNQGYKWCGAGSGSTSPPPASSTSSAQTTTATSTPPVSSFSATSTSTSTSTSSPTGCAGPADKAATGSSILIGYWHSWANGAPYSGKGFTGTAPYMRLNALPLDYNVIHVSFATGGADASLRFAPTVQSVAEFKSDVQAAKAQGRKVLISVGGADAPLVVDRTNNATFASTLKGILDTYDFDGVDIDFEQGSVASTDAVSLGWAMRTVRAQRHAQGKPCYFAMAPEFPYLRNGMYVTLGNMLLNEWDWVSPQLYNQGGDGIWVQSLGATVTASSGADFLREMYKAFVDNAYKQFGVVFSQSQFVLGLPATNWAAGSGYISPAEITKAVGQLKGIGYSPKGLMDWSVNWDQTDCYSFLGAYRMAFTTSTPASTSTSTAAPASSSTTTSTTAASTTSATTATSTGTSGTCKCMSNSSQASNAWCQTSTNGDPLQLCKAYPNFCKVQC